MEIISVSKINIPPGIIKLMQKIEDRGFKCYIIGGSVRDIILKKKTDDFDLATSALPTDIKSIFHNFNLFNYGERHGTIGFMFHKKKIEITTFRSEEGYSDGRRPDKVMYISDLKEDLSRRDFTINAIASDKSGRLIDYFNGLDDINSRIIRAVGAPDKRFDEDSLRIFRAVRFAIKLNFIIEPQTRNAIKRNSQLIKTHKISGERILSELNQIFMKFDKGIKLLHELNILKEILPELYYNNNIDLVIKNIEKKEFSSIIVPWSIIYYYITQNENQKKVKKIIDNINNRFPGLGNNKINLIKDIVTKGYIPDELSRRYIKSYFYRWAKEFCNPYISLSNEAQLHIVNNIIEFNNCCNSIFRIQSDEFKNKYKKYLFEIFEIIIRNPNINGNDIKAHGFTGKNIGIILNLCQLLFERNKQLEKKDYINYINHLKSNLIIDLFELRHRISFAEKLFNEDENKALVEELRDILKINQIYSKNTIIVGCEIDLKYINSILEMNPSIILLDYIIRDPIKLNKMSSNFYKSSINELEKLVNQLDKKIIFILTDLENKNFTLQNYIKLKY